MPQQILQAGGFKIDILVQGYPGKSVCHGGLGWSTVALIREDSAKWAKLIKEAGIKAD